MSRALEREPRRSRVTVKDLAQHLGMSVSTVSRAFYDDAVIAPETRERVLSKASEIGYQPNPLARGLITKSSRIVGVVVSDITNPFYPEVLTSLTERIQAVGFNVMLVVEQPNRPQDGLDVLLSYYPDIVIILATTLSSDASNACRRVGTPVIFFNRHASDEHSFSVTCDNIAGGAMVADFLLDRGFQRLAFVSGRPDASTNRDRWMGFSRRCATRSAPPPLASQGRSFTYEQGYEGTLELFRGPTRPDALFCANDILAVGALDAIRREGGGLRVPEDVAIVGFDDIAMASWPSYDLTTVRQPVDRMIDGTIDLTVALTRGEVGQPAAQRHPGTLIERNTTRVLI